MTGRIISPHRPRRRGDTEHSRYLVDTNVVTDPVYLQLPFMTAIHFKKEPDGSKWDPTPCDARF